MEYKSIKGLRYFLFIFLGFIIITDVSAYFVFINIIKNSENDYKNDRYSAVNTFMIMTKQRFNKYKSPIDFINKEQDLIRKDLNQRNVYAYYITDSTLFPILTSKSFNFNQKYIRSFFMPILKDNLSMRFFIDDNEVYSFKIENNNSNVLFAVIVYKTSNDYIGRVLKYFMIYKIVILFFILLFSAYLVISIEKPLRDISNIAKSLNIKFDSNDQHKVVKVFKDSIEEIIQMQKEQENAFGELQMKYDKMEKNYLAKEGMMKLSEITNGIAHQLNNQLGSISGLIQASLRSNDPLIFEEVFKQIKVLNEFTKKFLEFSREVKPYLSKVDIIHILKNTLLRYEISCELSEMPESFVIDSDELLMEQILINLMDNISKYTKSKKVKISISEIPNIISLKITDSGPGYPQEILENLYKPFSNSSHGYGLGIPTMIKLSSILNLKLEFKNIDGKGICELKFTRKKI